MQIHNLKNADYALTIIFLKIFQVVVDTLSPWDKDVLIAALKESTDFYNKRLHSFARKISCNHD